MTNQGENLFRRNCKFEVSFRYDLFYSLNVLLDPGSRIHSSWRASSLQILGPEFNKLSSQIGHSWEIWPVLAAILPGPVFNPGFLEIINGIQSLSIVRFQEKIIEGLIHLKGSADLLIKNEEPLKEVLAKVPKPKQEWLSHIGLFPYDSRSPQVIALEKLIKDPEQFRENILGILKIFWKKVFRKLWDKLLPQVQRSLQERERLFHSCSFAEFVKLALLRIEVDERKGALRAIRGGYALRFEDVKNCYFLPSAFNDRRFWSAFQEGKELTTVYFPYFDPSISLDTPIAIENQSMTEPPLDPALIFKALGDSTRFAIATIVARAPTTSVELAKRLSVSKPTISHHVHLLREAGLIRETPVNGSIELHINRTTIDSLSDLTIAKLFDSTEPIALTRTRGGAIS